MKNFLLLFISINFSFTAIASVKDPVFAELTAAINNKNRYSTNKEGRISTLKKLFSTELSSEALYDCNKNLYLEYRKFKLDSAIFFVEKNLHLADQLKNQFMKDQAHLQLANLYSSSGKYRESEKLLLQIKRKQISPKLLPIYFEVYSQFFEHYVTNSYNSEFYKLVEIYRDSLLQVLPKHSNKYKINLAQHNMFSGNYAAAEKNLLQLYKSSTSKNADFAMFAYLLGDIYKHSKNAALEKKFYAISAISDITNAIKDNAAIQSLALIYYEAGDIDNAYKFTRSAIEDAIFCNVKFRTLQISELYSIINTAYLEKEARQKGQLKTYLILISLLSLFLVIAVIYVYKQMRKVSKIREKLHISGEKLAVLNDDISRTNDQLNLINSKLSESNHIKEEYIAHFFDMCSAYIRKLEDYRKMLNRKASDKQLDELFRLLKSTTVVDNELEELYKNFDTIFINLYPTFVTDFNELLVPEEKVILKNGESLNTELRIFALIRLGINDSVKIAAFLRYSLSTIYNYRTKTRNKAAVSRDEFEIMVSKIGNIAEKNTLQTV